MIINDKRNKMWYLLFVNQASNGGSDKEGSISEVEYGEFKDRQPIVDWIWGFLKILGGTVNSWEYDNRILRSVESWPISGLYREEVGGSLAM